MAGFSRQQLIETVQRRTEKRGETLDLRGTEFLTALQEVVMERRWWWRRKVKLFDLVTDQAEYPLTDTTVDFAEFQQVAKRGFKLFASSSEWWCPSAEFDSDAQDSILAFPAPSGKPSRYFLHSEDAEPVLVLDPPPASNYRASLAAWVVPSYALDSSAEDIPIVPSYLHGLLAKRLELHIERFALGESSSKYKLVAAEYEELLEKASAYQDFAEGRQFSLASQIPGDAIQSS